MVKCNECNKNYKKSEKTIYTMKRTKLHRCPYCGNFEDSYRNKTGFYI